MRQATDPAPAPAGTAAVSDIVLERLTRLHPKVIDLSLGRVEDLLARLGHPERQLAPVVHAAGTNGKGSLLAYLRTMLEAAGQRVQCYTSPHLVQFHERIRLTSGLIPEPDLVQLLAHCEEVNGGQPITFFEITTAAAFLAFSQEAASVLLLETGLGGRLDATNVIDRPRLTVITPISVDHTQFLGDSLKAIAFEKAGILKPGVTAVIGRQPPAALKVLEDRAAEIGAPLHRLGKEWQARAKAGGFVYEDADGTVECPAPALAGDFQIDNAALAVACAARLPEFLPSPTEVRRGVAEAVWPARLQRLDPGPLADLLAARSADEWELWLDGGHNPDAGRALAKFLETWGDRPRYLVLGMMNTKAASDYIAAIAPYADALFCIAIPGEPNSFSAEEVTSAAQRAGYTAAPRTSVREVLAEIADTLPAGRVLVCGSLYLAGRVLAENR